MLDFIPPWLLKPLLALVEHWPWLRTKVNAWSIDRLANACPHRPHPWSTFRDYVSWTSLSDQHYSARHLPATYLPNLPTPEGLELMFKRPDDGHKPNRRQKLCPKSTLLFPAFAQYLTDGFIRTRMPVETIGETDEVRKQNTSNHQIDLCTLYGRTRDQTEVLRLMSTTRGQLGRLKSQMIGQEEYSPFLLGADGQIKPEFQVLDVPLGLNNVLNPEMRASIFATGGDRVNSAPQVAMMNTLFLREHNRLAQLLEHENPDWDDEHVFQVARNIVIVVFIKLVVEEYINHISQFPFRLRADPSVAWNAPWNKPNWITTEFSLLYRWHSLIPDQISWSGVEYPCDNTFLNNNLLIATDLATAFAEMSTQKAGRIGAFNTSDGFLQSVELHAIRQSRVCNLAPYVAYRQLMGLSVPQRFEDISPDPNVVAFLRTAYRNRVSDVDFYLGLFAEPTLRNSPLPELMQSMVAADAFSQALTNPLLSEHVFNANTFTDLGWNTIQTTTSLRDILERNSPVPVGDRRISMTQEGWTYQ